MEVSVLKKYIILTCILVALLLTACMHSNQPPADGSDESTQAIVQTIPTAAEPSTQPTEKQSAVTQPADSAELDAYTELFGNNKSWYNRALTCQYETPKELSLLAFFYCGFQDETRATEAEWEALKDKEGFNVNYDFYRLPVDKMSEVLNKCFGITLEDVADSGFEGLTYLESTNCYYFMATGFNSTENFKAKSIDNLEDGSIRLLYTAFYNGDEYEVIFKVRGEGYQILSNQLAE